MSHHDNCPCSSCQSAQKIILAGATDGCGPEPTEDVLPPSFSDLPVDPMALCKDKQVILTEEDGSKPARASLARVLWACICKAAAAIAPKLETKILACDPSGFVTLTPKQILNLLCECAKYQATPTEDTLFLVCEGDEVKRLPLPPVPGVECLDAGTCQERVEVTLIDGSKKTIARKKGATMLPCGVFVLDERNVASDGTSMGPGNEGGVELGGWQDATVDLSTVATVDAQNQATTVADLLPDCVTHLIVDMQAAVNTQRTSVDEHPTFGAQSTASIQAGDAAPTAGRFGCGVSGVFAVASYTNGGDVDYDSTAGVWVTISANKQLKMRWRMQFDETQNAAPTRVWMRITGYVCNGFNSCDELH